MYADIDTQKFGTTGYTGNNGCLVWASVMEEICTVPYGKCHFLQCLNVFVGTAQHSTAREIVHAVNCGVLALTSEKNACSTTGLEHAAT